MRRALVDTNVFVYALGARHRYREPCRRLVSALAEREIAGEISVEVVQEFVHVRRRGGRGDAIVRARELLAFRLPLHVVEPDDLDLALSLLDEHTALPVRDAVHAATALNRGLDAIISTDADFDAVPNLERIDPADRGAVAALSR